MPCLFNRLQAASSVCSGSVRLHVRDRAHAVIPEQLASLLPPEIAEQDAEMLAQAQGGPSQGSMEPAALATVQDVARRHNESIDKLFAPEGALHGKVRCCRLRLLASMQASLTWQECVRSSPESQSRSWFCMCLICSTSNIIQTSNIQQCDMRIENGAGGAAASRGTESLSNSD